MCRRARTRRHRSRCRGIQSTDLVVHSRVGTAVPAFVSWSLGTLIARTHVDGDELENSVLRKHAHDRLLPSLVVPIHEWESSSVRANEGVAGVGEGLIRMNGDGGRGRNVDSLLNVCVL